MKIFYLKDVALLDSLLQKFWNILMDNNFMMKNVMFLVLE